MLIRARRHDGAAGLRAFVVDYGVMWAGRGQAQNAADAGALSGAIALAFDSPTDFAGAKTKARVVAQQNWVWGQAPQRPADRVTFPPCPPGAPGLPDTCVKVDVFRNQARGNPLPIFFANLVGVASQGVRATATAQIVTGDTTDCLKPWAIVDRWDEFNGAHAEHDYPNPDPDFNPGHVHATTSIQTGKGKTRLRRTIYMSRPARRQPAPDSSCPLTKGASSPSKPTARVPFHRAGSWRSNSLDPMGIGPAANKYRNNIRRAADCLTSIATPGIACPADISQADAPYWATKGCFGVKTGGTVGPTRQGIDFLTGAGPVARLTNTSTKTSSAATFSPPTKKSARGPRLAHGYRRLSVAKPDRVQWNRATVKHLRVFRRRHG